MEVAMTSIELTGSERLILQCLAAHSDDARLVQRAYALLWLDDGESLADIAERLCVSRQSVYNWISYWEDRAEQEISQRLSDAPRSGRPPTAKGIIDPLIDEILDSDPRSFGYRSTVWTAQLLVHYLSDKHRLNVSDDSVRLAIIRLGVRWKRLRHHLGLRDPRWRQAKGGLKRGSKGANAASS